MEKYSHLVEYLDEQSKIVIYRMYENGDKVLYTEVEFPPKPNKKTLDEFIVMFAENILLDSRIARQKLGL